MHRKRQGKAQYLREFRNQRKTIFRMESDLKGSFPRAGHNKGDGSSLMDSSCIRLTLVGRRNIRI